MTSEENSPETCRSLQFSEEGVRIVCVTMEQTSTVEMLTCDTGLFVFGKPDAKSILSNCNVSFFTAQANHEEHVSFDNLIFENSAIYTGNIYDLTVNNCSFFGTNKIYFSSNNESSFQVITIKATRFTCENDVTLFQGSNRRPLHLEIIGSILYGCQIMLKTESLALFISDSIFNQSDIKANAKSYKRVPSLIVLSRTFFVNENLGQNVFLSFEMTNPHLEIIQCKFISVSLSLVSHKYHVLGHLTHIYISESQFLNSSQSGNGGALSVFSDVPNSRVEVSSCVFSRNMVHKDDAVLSGFGGALYTEGDPLSLLIIDCSFDHNFAAESGGSLYATSGVSVFINNCSFVYDIADQRSLTSTVVTSMGKTQNLVASFKVLNSKPKELTAQTEVLHLQHVSEATFVMECPAWYTYTSDYVLGTSEGDSSPKYLTHLVGICNPCQETYYANRGKEQKLWFYTQNRSVWSNFDEMNTISEESCQACPYGAQCPGNNVVARPNYWGYWHKEELVFQQCPTGYCCAGSATAPCDGYNLCAGNRAGDMCGACQQGFSVSILTGECTPDHQCGRNGYFWFVALLATLAYCLWYTFKDDIMSFILSLPHTIYNFVFFKPTTATNINKVRPAEPGVVEAWKASDSTLSERSKTGDPSSRSSSATEDVNTDDVDKGYFGIVTFFVQMSAAMKVTIEFSEIAESESLLDKMRKYIDLGLNMELTQFSFKVCPIVGLSNLGKHVYKPAFLLGIYINWTVLYLLVSLSQRCLSKTRGLGHGYKITTALKHKLIQGIVEIIKYTYSGFCGVIFMSLVCVQLKDNYVWLYDASRVCLENWQVWMIVAGLFYALPLPGVLFYGVYLLKQNLISSSTFLLSCHCPLIALVIMFIMKAQGNWEAPTPDQKVSGAREAIVSALQGPYREDEKHMTLYWESVVTLRRLLITGVGLVGYASIRMTIIFGFCIFFLLHHCYCLPFQVRTSNNIESLSLAFLVVVAAMNLLKACLTEAGVVPSGPSVPFFKGLEFSEKFLAIILIVIIVLTEIFLKVKRSQESKQEAKMTKENENKDKKEQAPGSDTMK